MNIQFENIGLFRITNTRNSHTYYILTENLSACMKEQLEQLQNGQHENQSLQNDFLLQEGQDFSAHVIQRDISLNTAQFILNMFVESDDNTYNEKCVGAASPSRA